MKIMNSLQRNYFWFAIILFLFCSCNSNQDFEIPKYVQDLKNVLIYPVNAQPVKKIHFQKEISFGDSEDVLIGTISNAIVDLMGRVYISDNQRKKVHVFSPEGKYLKSLGNEGRGPGEFQFLGEMSIYSNQLIVNDIVLFRMNVFSLETLEFVKAHNLQPSNQRDFDELNGLQPSQHFIINDSLFIINFKPPRQLQLLDEDRFIQYYIQNHEGEIISEKILTQRDTPYLKATIEGRTIPVTFTFLGQSLIALSPDGMIHAAWSENFLIKKFNLAGGYKSSFYYPFKKRKLNRENVINISSTMYQKNVLRNVDLPETWPAIDNFFIDDENRFWVSTIIDADDMYEWWVLEPNGNLLATFRWEGNLLGYSREIQYVKNGKMYTWEMDDHTGQQRIVRYQIEMKNI